MRKLNLLFLCLIFSFQMNAQSWAEADTGLPVFYWTGQMDEFNGELYVISGSPWGVFPYYIAKWNGSFWSTIPSVILPNSSATTNTFLNNVGSYNGYLVAVGRFDSIENVPSHNIALWDGIGWSAVDTTRFMDDYDTGISGQILTAIEYQGELYVGGAFYWPYEGFAKWDGTQWLPVGTNSNYGELIGQVHELKVIDGKLYVFGAYLAFTNASPNITAIAVWDGNNWVSVESCQTQDAITGVKDSSNYYYYSISNQELYYQDSASGSCTIIIPSGELSSDISAVSKYKGEYYFGGWFDPFPSCPGCMYLGKWDGVNLSQVLPNNASHVDDLAIYNGDLYMTGDGGFSSNLNSNVIYFSDTSSIPLANFYANRVRNVPGDSVLFEYNGKNATSYQWSFPGGAPSASTSSSQRVAYSSPGEYTVTLIVGNGISFDTLVRPAAAVIVNSMTSLQQAAMEPLGIRISPNPSHSYIQLSCQEKVLRCEIFAVDGRKMLTVYPELEKFNLDLSRLETGLYEVRCYGIQKTGVSKLIVD